jgi:hypothetical protein
VVKLLAAPLPTAVLLDPSVTLHKAVDPIEVLPDPVVLEAKVNLPTAVLKLPVVLFHSDLYPAATLPPPVVLLNKVIAPTAVLWLLLPPEATCMDLNPMAVFSTVPMLAEASAQKPKAVLQKPVDNVQPKTIPATVGVAAVPPPPPAVPQQMALTPLDINT